MWAHLKISQNPKEKMFHILESPEKADLNAKSTMHNIHDIQSC